MIRSLLQKNLIIRTLASLRITTACLFLLFILTLWGTIAQIDQGLYQAQHRFFFPWGFAALGFIPFPGAKLVLWVLFINLMCVTMVRFVFKWSYLGILVIHLGLLTYFVAALITYQSMKESNVTLLEEGGTNLSSSYMDWEIALWKSEETKERHTTAFDVKNQREEVVLPGPKIKIFFETYYPNASAFTAQGEIPESGVLNVSGIVSLTARPLEREPEKNIPGVVLKIEDSLEKKHHVILFGSEINPTTIAVNGQAYHVQLRRKRFVLPFVITLKEFTKKMHPGTEIAKSYQSLVSISHDDVIRDVLIYMNHPLRFKDYTLYQASYSIDQMGRERSTLAVVKNSGKFLPYAASLITFAGLVIHFLSMAFKGRQR
jgi:uncharacterized membrane protein YidH (DUF202 family)